MNKDTINSPVKFTFNSNQTSSNNEISSTNHTPKKQRIDDGLNKRYNQLLSTPPTNKIFLPLSIQSPISKAFNINNDRIFPTTSSETTLLSPKVNRDNEYLSIITTMLKLLDRKRSLIDYLTLLNNSAEKLKKMDDMNIFEIDKDFKSIFTQRYAWILVQLDKTTKSLNEGLNRIRNRYENMSANSIQAPHTSVSPLPTNGQLLLKVSSLSNEEITLQAKKKADELIKQIRIKLLTDGIIPPFSPIAKDQQDSDTNDMLSTCLTLIYLLRLGCSIGFIPGNISVLLQKIKITW